MLQQSSEKNNGFVALISILIVNALILVIAISLSLRSIGSSRMSFAEREASRALSLANLCAEQALIKLESVLNYSGNEIITIGADSCNIFPIGGSGNYSRTITTQSVVTNYTRKIKVVVSQVSPIMQITSWDQVADF
ncbi:hypothetical protein HZB04_01140 [Candidatus Wolfebacteria bacterium]|nr:hypothetical protein [Candidatus Wolfebacteria bacterium]